jgi:hypothetical protein
MMRKPNVVLCCALVLLVAARVLGGEPPRQPKQQLRQWTVKYFKWELTDPQEIRAFKERKARSIPKDAKQIAAITIYRTDAEDNAAVCTIGKDKCAVIVAEAKGENGSATMVRFFYLGDRSDIHSTDTVKGDIIDNADLEKVQVFHTALGWFGHGIVGERGGGISVTLRMLLCYGSRRPMSRK